MVFNPVLPEIFVEAIENFFSDDINKIFAFKTNESFKGTTLNKFMDDSAKLEDALLSYSDILLAKKNHLAKIKKEFEGNNEKMRDLNERICIRKVERSSFSEAKKIEEMFGDIIPDI